MSASDKPLAPHVFSFGGGLSLRVECRRLPAEVARVTQTLQLDVEELFANLLDWGGGSSAQAHAPVPHTEAGECGGDQQPQPPQQPHPERQQGQQQEQAQQGQQLDSKQLCGNVASDAPDLIGLDIWPASIALCRYLAAHPHLVLGQHVLELGAGMGLPGLLSASLGAASVLLTDYEPVVVQHMQRSAQQNGVAATCTCLTLDWFDLAQLPHTQRHAQDLLLLADVIYAAAVVQPLVATLLALLRPASGVALVAHRIRRPLIFDRVDNIARLQEQDEIFEEFKAACQAAGLHVHLLNDCPATQAGDQPLLLVIGPSPAQLQRFPAPPPPAGEEEEAAAGGEASGATVGSSTAAVAGAAERKRHSRAKATHTSCD